MKRLPPRPLGLPHPTYYVLSVLVLIAVNVFADRESLLDSVLRTLAVVAALALVPDRGSPVATVPARRLLTAWLTVVTGAFIFAAWTPSGSHIEDVASAVLTAVALPLLLALRDPDVSEALHGPPVASATVLPARHPVVVYRATLVALGALAMLLAFLTPMPYSAALVSGLCVVLAERTHRYFTTALPAEPRIVRVRR